MDVGINLSIHRSIVIFGVLSSQSLFLLVTTGQTSLNIYALLKVQRFLKPKPPSFFGLQICSQEIGWHFWCSSLLPQIKLRQSLSAFSQVNVWISTACIT